MTGNPVVDFVIPLIYLCALNFFLIVNLFFKLTKTGDTTLQIFYGFHPTPPLSFFLFLWFIPFICGVVSKIAKEQEPYLIKVRDVSRYLFYMIPALLWAVYHIKKLSFLRFPQKAYPVLAQISDSINKPLIFTVLVFFAIYLVCILLSYMGIGSKTLQEQIRDGKIKYPRAINDLKYLDKSVKSFQKGKDIGSYLGYNLFTRRPEYLTANQRLLHTHIVGTTGSGKTVSAVFPLIEQDIIRNRGIIFIDAKGDILNAKTIYKMAKENNREQDFLFFSIAHPEYSHTYNPLQHGNPTQLKDKITATIEWSEPHYQRICENALQILFMEHGNNPITLKDLYSILRNPSARYHEFSNFKEQHQKDIATPENEIGILINTTFAGLLNQPKAEIDLLDAVRNQKIIYFALDTQSFGETAKRLGKMITQDLNVISGIIQSTTSERERTPIGIYIDEYQAFGTKNFINCLARGRASGFMITIAHQSIGDLNAIDKAYTQQVNQNTNTKIFLQSNDPDTIQLFSDMLVWCL